MVVIKAAGLLGSAIKLAKKVSKLCVKLPQRSLSTDPTLFKTPGQGGYVTPGFDFEHPPFGHYYKMYCDVDVPTGDDDLPLWVDWSRIPGAVPPAYHQNGVGICYLCSTISGMSSVNFIMTGESVLLSLQHYIDCCSPAINANPLCGGDSRKVLDFVIANGGILPESLYPYTGIKGVCKNIEGMGVSIDEWRRVKPGCELSLKYALAYQPVIVEVFFGDFLLVNDFYMDPFAYYGGIIQGSSPLGPIKSNHNLLLLGYGEPEPNRHAWRGINSYGPDWGENGKFWVETGKGVGKERGTMGVLNCPIVPLKWTNENAIVKSCRIREDLED